jgi:two-component system, response regulator YesN
MYNIVLVDDERLELDTLENYVPWEEMGFKVIGTAKNGKEALSKMGELLPDIVITDVKMPIMDGVEFADIIRGRLPQLKIIFLSGYDDFSYVKSALQMEASGYLLMPLDMDELRKLMEKVKAKCMEDQLVKLSI